MDPTANLNEQRRLACKLLNTLEEERSQADVDRLCELVVALDEWLMTGGFLPAPWQEGR